MRAKNVSVVKRFLSILLCVSLIFGLLPAIAHAEEVEAASDSAVDSDENSQSEPQYSESDYTYMYLVTAKKYTYNTDDKKYEKYTYKYNEHGMVAESNKDGNKTTNKSKLGETTYEYDGSGNLTDVDGPYFDFAYSYNKKGRLVKYDMSCLNAISTWKGPFHYAHKLKYTSKNRSIHNPDCPGLLLLSKDDKYFFKKNHKPLKMYHYRQKGSWYLGKDYYKYDKKGNLSQEKQVFKTENWTGSTTYNYKNSYKSGRLTKRKTKNPPANDIASVTYKYKKIKVLKKYTDKVTEQQWRILNFDDMREFGIDQPWKY